MGPVFIGEVLFPHTSSGCCYRARGEWSILQLLTQAPVETFHKTVLHWLSRLNTRPADTGLILPFQEGSGGEFGAVVAHDRVRLAIEPDQVADSDLRDLMAIQHVQSCGLRRSAGPVSRFPTGPSGWNYRASGRPEGASAWRSPAQAP